MASKFFTLAKAITMLLWLPAILLAQKTVHVFNPWVSDPIRSAYNMYIQGQDGAGFNNWWPGVTMRNEGGGWYAHTFNTTNPNSIQFKIMNSADNNGSNKLMLNLVGQSDQDYTFNNLADWQNSDDIYMYYQGDQLVITATPLHAKYLMILSPFASAPLLQLDGQSAAKAMLPVENPCGWYAMPFVDTEDLQVRLVGNGQYFGSAGLGSTEFIDLSAAFATSDSVWLSTHTGIPTLHEQWNGQEGRCAVMRLASYIRDFATDKSHPDFEAAGENWSNPTCGDNGSTGLVANHLGPDRKPIKIKSGCHNTYFDQWFGREPGNYFTGCLDLDLHLNSNGSYEKRDDAFFPLDHIGAQYGNLYNGLGVDISPDGSVHQHNYGFCMETHAKFTYKGTEIFTFKGDDDVWVFINDSLVVDLGGTHNALEATVDLRNLGLTVGQVYTFDFFFCERQSTESHMWITTDIDLIEDQTVILDREVLQSAHGISHRYSVWLNTIGGVGCVSENSTVQMPAIYKLQKKGSTTQVELGTGSHYDGGIVIAPTRDTVTIDTTKLTSLDVGSTYILYIINPQQPAVYDSILVHTPGTIVPPAPNNPPVFTGDSLRVSEVLALEGVVGVLRATDADGDALTWTIAANDYFAIDQLGRITLKKALNWKSQATHNITVTVSDGKDVVSATVVISVDRVAKPIDVTIINLTAGSKVWPRRDTVYVNVHELDIKAHIDGTDVIASSDTVVAQTLKNGKQKIGVQVCDVLDPSVCGFDSIVVVVNIQVPTVDWDPVRPDTSGSKNLVYTYIPSDTVFINDAQKTLSGKLTFVDTQLKNATTAAELALAPLNLKEGFHRVPYSWTDDFGNTVYDTLSVYVDLTPPVVKINSPGPNDIFTVYNIDVEWTVDLVLMDTLLRASLNSGSNSIIRSAMDRAGNVGSDTVYVILKEDKNKTKIDLLAPVVQLKPQGVKDYFTQNPPHPEGQYVLTLYDHSREQEVEVGWGTNKKSFGTTETNRVYGAGGTGYVGPTLRIEMPFQHVGGINGEGKPRGGTVADLLEWAASEGVSASDALCGEPVPSDPYKTPLWKNSLYLEVQVFDQLGQYINRYVTEVDSIAAQHLNDGGLVEIYFSLTPDAHTMQLKDYRGRDIATGPYLMRTYARGTSTYLWCAGQYSKGDKLKTTETILRNFGYRRLESTK